MPRPSRAQEILQALAAMLETRPGARITTAALAAELGVSESALYRHFASKAKMIAGLIEFAEETLLDRVARIRGQDETAAERCGAIVLLLLTFCERNPGFARLFAGDGLLGEAERLRVRVGQLYDRLETELRQILREELAFGEERGRLPADVAANLLLAAAEGRINQFVRSGFKRRPTENWAAQWAALARGVL